MVAHGASRGNNSGIPRVGPEPRRGERNRRHILSPLRGWKNIARIRHPQLTLWSRVRGIARLTALQIYSFDVSLVSMTQ
jgi:hypothetical protein